MTYSEKLKDPRWQKKRLEILQRDEFRCRNCFDNESELHVHHQVYRKDPWDCPDHFLVTLCKECHSYVTAKKKQLDDHVASMNPMEFTTFCEFVDYTRIAMGANWMCWITGLYTTIYGGKKSARLLKLEFHTKCALQNDILEVTDRKKTGSE
jgi:hypothetical protein